MRKSVKAGGQRDARQREVPTKQKSVRNEGVVIRGALSTFSHKLHFLLSFAVATVGHRWQSIVVDDVRISVSEFTELFLSAQN